MRNKFFYIYDKLFRGGVISSHLSEIENFYSLSEDDFLRLQKEKLNKIVEYAIKNCEFYKTFSDFDSFPIIDKNIIKKNFNKFIAKDCVESSLIPVVTSGSTGTPFTVYQDKNKKDRNTADTIYFANKANYKVGEPLLYLKIWNNINSKSGLKHKIQNIIPVNVFELSETAIGNYLEGWNKYNVSFSILGYASAILDLAKYISQNKRIKKFKVHSIITMSESLDEKSKIFISQVFDCNVFSRYSNVENGIIAQNYNSSYDFLINSPSYFIEILKLDKDEPQENGELGRIIVTDFYNTGMPIIRYDTGDLAIKHINKTGNKFFEVLTNIEGRKMDAIYNTKDDLISSFIITNSMWNFPEINQYQFIQIGRREYKFVINIDREFEREGNLLKQFQNLLGSDAIIGIEYVNEIPLLASGKRKKVVNRMNK